MAIKDNRISLGNAIFNPAVFQGAVFTPQQENMSLLQHSLDKLDERKEKTDQQTAAIMSAINNVKLDSSENTWKKDYVNRIKNQIKSASQFGDYSSALETATRLAGEAVTSPELLGRQRYYEERQKWLEDLKTRNARGEIDSDTYNRAVSENKYNYSDTYDNEGNVTGGISWNPAFNPVKDIDLGQVMREIKALITPSSRASSITKGTSTVYLNEKGEQTTNVNEARGIFSKTSGGGSSSSYTGVTAKEWADAYDAWVSQHPEAIQQFEQKRQNVIWNWKQNLIKAGDENISEDERKIADKTATDLYQTLIDDQGGLLTPENYARSITNPMFKVMQYSQRGSSVVESSTELDPNTLRNKTVSALLGFNVDAEIWAASSPIERAVMAEKAASLRNSKEHEAKSFLEILANGVESSTYKAGGSWQ